MTESWEPITRVGHPEIKDLSSDGRVLVEIQLSGSPPTAWVSSFIAQYTSHLVRSPDDDWPLPDVRGDKILIQPLENDLATWIRLVDERMALTNVSYETTDLPAQQQREAAKREEVDKHRERLERLRREAQQL